MTDNIDYSKILAPFYREIEERGNEEIDKPINH